MSESQIIPAMSSRIVCGPGGKRQVSGGAISSTGSWCLRMPHWLLRANAQTFGFRQALDLDPGVSQLWLLRPQQSLEQRRVGHPVADRIRDLDQFAHGMCASPLTPAGMRGRPSKLTVKYLQL